jgi:hypothetical protein
MNYKRVNTTQKSAFRMIEVEERILSKFLFCIKICTCLIGCSWFDRAHYNCNWNTSKPLDSSLTQMSPKFQIEFGACKFHTDKFNHWNNFTLFSIYEDFYLNFFVLF